MYATVQDMEARYGEMDAAEARKAEILLSDASAIVQMEGGKTELTDVEAVAYKAVVCEMVHSVMTQPEYGDISQHSKTAGSFTESFSFRSPPGSLRLTIPQRKLLGLKKMKIGSIAPEVHHAG